MKPNPEFQELFLLKPALRVINTSIDVAFAYLIRQYDRIEDVCEWVGITERTCRRCHKILEAIGLSIEPRTDYSLGETYYSVDGLSYVDIHEKFDKYIQWRKAFKDKWGFEKGVCSECGEKTIPTKRSSGMCLNCYHIKYNKSRERRGKEIR